MNSGKTIRQLENVGVDNLQAYKAYWFCVSGFGVQGEGMQSDPALGRAA